MPDLSQLGRGGREPLEDDLARRHFVHLCVAALVILLLFKMVDRARRKEDIILDIGSEQTKVGISCDKVPRRTIRTLQLFKTDEFGASW